MSHHKPRSTNEPKPPKSHGWMAEFSDEHKLLVAASKVRDAGYTSTDAFTPFPVHGIDEALGIKPTILPFIVLCLGTCGTITALVLQYWTNAVDYPYIISGKPLGITPASIPVTFELTVLFSAFTAVFAMLGLNGLPRFSNPVFNNPKFDRATDDKFFLYVNANDKYYNRDSVRELLGSTQPESLEEVIEDSSSASIPRPIWLGALLIVLTGLIPLMVVLNMRASFSEWPRWHVFFDMDFQPKKKPQQRTTIFADHRTMRPQASGTVARGQLTQQDPFYLGYDPAKVALIAERGAILVHSADIQPPEEPKPEEPKPTEPKPEEPKGEETKPQDPVPADTKPSDDGKAADEAKPAEQTEEPKPASTEQPKAGDAEVAPKPEPAPAPAPQDTKASDSAAPAAAAGQAAAGPNLPWLTTVPMDPKDIDEDLMKLGKTKFDIYCSVCHGYAGFGDGLVQKRASALMQDTWTPPTSLHIDRLQKQPVGQIFYTITNGQGKMAPYGSTLSPKERWAIVLYVKALQRSRNASIEDVPVDQRSSLSTKK